MYVKYLTKILNEIFTISIKLKLSGLKKRIMYGFTFTSFCQGLSKHNLFFKILRECLVTQWNSQSP